ncbi:HEAT repeat domain-containing protein [Halogeometricum luteum]|uniref:HEAT repeat domain-containing protein n=1 Tax=Halogeometricum luteum TaxID=2950537 RepID=A0ABU2G4E1_9EURY|nr:HEAT repeat domain-containing protein [Halogeometricum sp. S3BR5-2]MDS0295661.1 HEAT repeat domain-containing protein [Halogeometricum sp. S3BR5-2]
MTANASRPLDGIEPESVTPEDIDDEEVRAALASDTPSVRQRGVEVCESFAATGVEAVRSLLDDVAPLAGDDNAAVALRAISVLDTVARSDPDALDGATAGLADAADSEIVDVQLTAATALGVLVVKRPDLVAPFVGELVAAIRATEPDPTPGDFSAVEDPVTRRTLEEHEESERQRRTSGRRTLVNVVVAVCEEEPESALGTVEGLVGLLDDVDPSIVGGAVDALGELAVTDPAAVAPAREELRARLDHPQTFVRARTVRALGRLGDEGAVPELRTLAETDDDEDVREIAAETAAFLAEES